MVTLLANICKWKYCFWHTETKCKWHMKMKTLFRNDDRKEVQNHILFRLILYLISISLLWKESLITINDVSTIACSTIGSMCWRNGIFCFWWAALCKCSQLWWQIGEDILQNQNKTIEKSKGIFEEYVWKSKLAISFTCLLWNGW